MRFYGGSLREWRALRYWDLLDLLAIARRLRARERLEAINDRMVSSGWSKPEDVRRHTRKLDHESRGMREVAGESTLADLSGAGIAVKAV